MTTDTNKDSKDANGKPSSNLIWVNEHSVGKGFGDDVDKLIQMDGTTFPHDPELEKRVVGDILTASDIEGDAEILMRQITPFLRHDDFYSRRYAAIYAAMLRIHARGDKVDVQSVVSDLRKRSQQALDGIGGEQFLTELTIGFANNTETHARDIVRLALFRATILAGYKMRVLGNRTDFELSELTDKISRNTRDIQARVSQLDERNVYDMSVYQKQYITQLIEDAKNPDFMPGLPIWIDKLQNPLYGWLPNNLYVLAAGTGMGKSQFEINAALDVAKQGKHVVLITLELDMPKIMDRILAILTGIDGKHIKERKLTPSHIAQLETLENAPHNPLEYLTIVHMNNPTMTEIHAKLDELFYRLGFEFVCIDYLGVETVRSDNMRYGGSTEHAAQIWQKMREIKMSYGVPFLVAAQVNRKYRERESKRPIVTDIANSSICEKASDVVMLFHRLSVIDNMGSINHADIEIAKNRDGKNGQMIDICFDEANGQITNWPDVPDAEADL